MERTCGRAASKEIPFTNRHKKILVVFVFCFVTMIVSLIPWNDFGVTIFKSWIFASTDSNFGDWYFGDLAMRFLFLGITATLIGRFTEKGTIEAFIDGVKDILSAVLTIVTARGASVLMSKTYLDSFILNKAASLLQGLSLVLSITGAFVLYLGLPFLIPSISGLAYVSIPVTGALVKNIGLSPEAMVMIFVSGCSLINLIMPTSGVVMGGLEISKVQYATWTEFMAKPMTVSGPINLTVLIGAMLLFS